MNPEKVVELILSMSPDPKKWDELVAALKPAEEFFTRTPGQVDHVLAVLNIQHHSLGFAVLLNCKASANVTTAAFMEQVQTFIRQCNASQIRAVPAKFANLCRHYGEWLISQRNYPLAVRDLRDAITRLRANNTQLTPLHPHYIKACILAKMYHMASHVVDIDSTELSGGVQARDLVLFFYYGGIALIGQKKFKRAQMFFQMGLAVPTTTVNAIGVETYKKLVLVSLLVDGKLPPLGRILSGAILRNIQHLCKPYGEFAQTFTTYDPDKAHAMAAQHAELFTSDHNMGLVKQCIQALYRRAIVRLTTTFMTLSLADIASRVHLPTPRDAEQLIVRMVEKGEIQATIDQSHGMVNFRESPESYASLQATQMIDRKIKSFIDVIRKERRLDEDITLSTPYIQRTLDGPMRGRVMRDDHTDLA